MKLLTVFTTVIFIIFSFEISAQIEEDFSDIIKDLKASESNFHWMKFSNKYPDFSFQVERFIKEEASTKLYKQALNFEPGEISEIILNEDRSCEFVQLLDRVHTKMMRVSYIYLADNSQDGRIAKQVLREHSNGTSFADLAVKYSKDGNTKNGGDLGWFQEKQTVADFENAVKNHQKGDVYKAFTREYGWYVIWKTHDSKEEELFKIVRVKKENCKQF